MWGKPTFPDTDNVSIPCYCINNGGETELLNHLLNFDREEMMSSWLCLTPNMLDAIASCSGNVYFVDASRCAVKMNGVMIKIQRVGNDWFVTSPNQLFYDLVGRCGKSTKRGTAVILTEIQMFGAITYICKIRPEEEK